MGAFEYTPSALPAIAKVNFQGKQYEFTLPKALPSGYILKVGNNAGAISVTVSCNAATPQDTLAVFISHQDVPMPISLSTVRQISLSNLQYCRASYRQESYKSVCSIVPEILYATALSLLLHGLLYKSRPKV